MCNNPVKKEDLYEIMEELNEDPGIIKKNGITKWINTDKIISIWYDKEDVEVMVGERITDEEYKILLREFYENFPFDAVNDYMREFAIQVILE